VANWLWTRKERVTAGIPFGFESYVFGPPGSGSVTIRMVPSINKQKIWKKIDFYS